MKREEAHENVLNDTDSHETLKSEILKRVMSEEFGKLSKESFKTEKTEPSKSYLLENREELTDTEYYKALMMFQAYPCLRYSIESYIPLMKRKVIGQDNAIRKLIYIAYYNQYLNFLEEYMEVDSFKRKSMLLIAPTGYGKSTMLRALEKAFDVPVHRANITATTSAGYVGDKVESMLLGLIERANGDIEKAQNGILLIDEIDKKVTSTTTERDVAGKAVQQELLKLFDKGTLNIPVNKEEKKTIKFYTGNLTIILAGACVGLDDIRKKRLNSNHRIGFSVVEAESNDSKEYTGEDLIEYGFIPELIGRVDVIEELEPYTVEKIIDIIYYSDESSMQEHVLILKSLGVEKIMVDGLLWERIAEETLKSNLGIRALNTMMEKLFRPILYEAFQHISGNATCTIDAEGGYVLTYPKENKVYTGKGIELKGNE